MNSSKLEFAISQFKSIMEEAPSPENGWSFEYEGIIDQNFKDSTMKIYNKTENLKCGFTTRVDAVLRGVKAKNLVLMTRDITYRKKAKHPPKKIKLIENNKNTDIIYVELDLPHPLINRDLVQKRLFVGNKEDPELVKELGLFDWDHEYHVTLIEPTQRLDYPPVEPPIRGQNIHYMLLEEDPNDESVLKVRLVMSTDLSGDVPSVFMNLIRQNAPYQLMRSIMTSYSQFFGKSKR